jgi:hypothetical protein
MSLFRSKLKFIFLSQFLKNIIVVTSLVCQAMLNSFYQPLDRPNRLKDWQVKCVDVVLHSFLQI